MQQTGMFLTRPVWDFYDLIDELDERVDEVGEIALANEIQDRIVVELARRYTWGDASATLIPIQKFLDAARGVLGDLGLSDPQIRDVFMAVSNVSTGYVALPG